jgi:hypothetical protein
LTAERHAAPLSRNQQAARREAGSAGVDRRQSGRWDAKNG